MSGKIITRMRERQAAVAHRKSRGAIVPLHEYQQRLDEFNARQSMQAVNWGVLCSPMLAESVDSQPPRRWWQFWK